MLPDRSPRTQTMTSHSICSKDFCDPCYTHPKKYYPPSVHLLPYRLLLSRFVSIWIGSVRATHHGQSMPLAIVHGSCDLGLTCGTYYCRENVEDAVEETDNRILNETECHSETIGVPHMKRGI